MKNRRVYSVQVLRQRAEGSDVPFRTDLDYEENRNLPPVSPA
jgi:hypothetical protein